MTDDSIQIYGKSHPTVRQSDSRQSGKNWYQTMSIFAPSHHQGIDVIIIKLIEKFNIQWEKKENCIFTASQQRETRVLTLPIPISLLFDGNVSVEIWEEEKITSHRFFSFIKLAHYCVVCFPAPLQSFPLHCKIGSSTTFVDLGISEFMARKDWKSLHWLLLDIAVVLIFFLCFSSPFNR